MSYDSNSSHTPECSTSNANVDYISSKKYHQNLITSIKVASYNPISNCKSAGVIPYALYQNKIYFLFQRAVSPNRRKNSGWNDFGGKRSANPMETTVETAAREFSEETSCLFYLKEHADLTHYYDALKHNAELSYSPTDITILLSLLPLSQKFFVNRINEFVLPIYVSSKETYISFLVKVEYILAADIPAAEDIHIPYETRYIRECKWFSMEELLALEEKDFHKRLQITRIKQRIQKYYNKGLFA